MRDYAEAARSFDYTQAVQAALQGNLQAMNACVECCDRHVGSDRPALIWEDRDGNGAVYSFDQLQALAKRFANVLKAQGVGAGDRVAGLMPRTPELLVSILATWRLGRSTSRYSPPSVPRRSSIAWSSPTPVWWSPSATTGPSSTMSRIARRSSRWARRPVSWIFIPSSTLPQRMRACVAYWGRPLPADVHLRHHRAGQATGGAVAGHRRLQGYMRDAIDLRPDDNFWNLADPGWAYGLYYAVTGPLALGHATTFYDGPFSVESCARMIDKHGITNLAGSPTAYRLLIAAGSDFSAPIKGRLRVVSSAGEPLNPEVIRWFADELGVTIHDHYGQTELGMVLCNHHALKHTVHPGSAGFAIPGHRIVVLNEQGNELPSDSPASSPSIANSRRYAGSGATTGCRPRPSSASTT